MREKRKSTRVQHSGFCILSREGYNKIETWHCDFINISVDGASIQCPDNWPGYINDNVRMTLILDGTDVELKLSATITHQQLGTLGIKFLTLNLDSLLHLQNIHELGIHEEALLDGNLHHLQAV